MPQQAFTCYTISNREKILPSSHLSGLKNEAASPKGHINSTSTSNRDAIHAHDKHECIDVGARLAHMVRKDFKALNIAKGLQEHLAPVNYMLT